MLKARLACSVPRPLHIFNNQTDPGVDCSTNGYEGLGTGGGIRCQSLTARRLSEELKSTGQSRVATRQSSERKSKPKPSSEELIWTGGSSQNTRHKLAAQRCRARVPILEISVVDSDGKTLRSVDVACLQDYDDSIAAFRELLTLKFRSRTYIQEKLNINGTGLLTMKELFDILKALHVEWQQVTGLTRAQLFALLDPKKEGSVLISDVLGFSEVTPRPSWSELCFEDQWNTYATEVALLDSRSSRVPSWESSRSFSTPKATPHNELAKDHTGRLPGESSIAAVNITTGDIDKSLRAMSEDTRVIAHLRKDIQSLRKSEDSLNDIELLRQRAEQQKRDTRLECSRALMQAAYRSGVSMSFFRNSKTLPSGDDWTGSFSRQPDTSMDAYTVNRELLRTLSLPYTLGERIQNAFLEHADKHHCINSFAQFAHIISTIKYIPYELIHESARHKQQWRNLQSSIEEHVSIESFLIWYARMFQ